MTPAPDPGPPPTAARRGGTAGVVGHAPGAGRSASRASGDPHAGRDIAKNPSPENASAENPSAENPFPENAPPENTSAKNLPAKSLPAKNLPAMKPAAGNLEAGGAETSDTTGFRVRLVNFEGPFDLLLQLIGKHKLDVTEVALSRVTDEFIAYIRAMGTDWDLDEASEFLVIAATLLDLKTARLLPSASVESEEDLALLEARDLLFARLLQYKAFKEAAAHLSGLHTDAAGRYARAVGLEPRFAEALPDLILGIGPQRLAQLAARAMTPRPVPVVSTDHVHQVMVSVREHTAILSEKLFTAGTASFRFLVADCASPLEVIARFLGLLELYREGLVGFTQVQPLGELTVRWTGGDSLGGTLEIDEYSGTPASASATIAPPAGAEQAGAEPAGAEPAGGEPAEPGVASGPDPAPSHHGEERYQE